MYTFKIIRHVIWGPVNVGAGSDLILGLQAVQQLRAMSQLPSLIENCFL